MVVGAEARFLNSQQARLNALRADKSTNERSQKIDWFWSSLRLELSAWSDELDALDLSYVSLSSSVSEADKRDFNLKIISLNEKIGSLRRHCLVHTLAGTDMLETELTARLPAVPDHLSATDLMLLHNEFVSHQTKLNEVKRRILPKGKFVFKRYRQAMALREAEKRISPEAGNLSKSVQTKQSSGTISAKLSLGVSALEGLRDCYVTSMPDGRVSISPSTIDSTSHVAPRILNDIQNSKISIRYPLDTLHIVGVQRSSIEVDSPISGAVHVTDCHDFQLTCTSHQLRLHDCTNLKCRVQVTAGAILEASRDIAFYTDKEDGLIVRDFQWLRPGIPSPHFSIEAVATEVDTSPNTQPQAELPEPSPPRTMAATNDNSRKTAVGDYETDDDDEL